MDQHQLPDQNEFELTSHGFETGEKVFYDSSNFITGLGTGSYFVHRIDDNKFNLTLTRKDSITEPPSIIDLQSWDHFMKLVKLIQSFQLSEIII